MSRMDIVLIGASGLARELMGYIEDDPRFRVICALDENTSNNLPNCEVISPLNWDGNCNKAIYAVGYPEHKQEILARYANFRFHWQTYIHPTAVVSKYANLGAGCIISPFAVVAGNACIGDFVFMNVYASVGHDAIVGKFSSLMPYSCVEGYAILGEECLISTGAKILPKSHIGNRSRVSAGSVVMQNMPEDTLIYGTPAKYQPDITMLRKRKKIINN